MGAASLVSKRRGRPSNNRLPGAYLGAMSLDTSIDAALPKVLLGSARIDEAVMALPPEQVAKYRYDAISTRFLRCHPTNWPSATPAWRASRMARQAGQSG